MSTRILLANGQRMVRTGLRLVLEREDRLEVVGEAGDGAMALREARRLEPDLVILDARLNGAGGVDAARRLRDGAPSARVMMLAEDVERRTVLAALQAGAAAYLLKEAAAEELVRAVDAVAAGHGYFCPRAAAAIAEQLGDGGEASAANGRELSRRQREVLRLLAEGKTSKQIGAALGLATKTVDSHRSELMRKLDLHSTAELTKYAVREGLTPLDG